VRRVAIRKAVQVAKREARRSWFERRAAAGSGEDGPQAHTLPDDGLWGRCGRCPRNSVPS
jgi:hypothetical protein